MMKKIVILVLLLNLVYTARAQVTIGSNIQSGSGALLDLKEKESSNTVTSNKGLGLPRVNLTNPYFLYPMFETTPGSGIANDEYNTPLLKDNANKIHTGLIVYNINECFGGGVGMYVWTGKEWIYLLNRKETRPALGSGTEDQSKYPGANTYVASQNETVTIPVKRAFSIWTDYVGNDAYNGKILDLASIGGSLSGTLSAEIVWEECADSLFTSGIITSINVDNPLGGENANIVVTVGNTHYGNALIALKKDGLVMWQWQIWVPQGDPEATAIGYNNNKSTYWFMDRHLGAVDNIQRPIVGSQITPEERKAHGTYYQWGRPTPIQKFHMTPKAGVVASVDSERENLTTAITKPTYIVRVDAVGADLCYTCGGNNCLPCNGDWYAKTSAGVLDEIWATRWCTSGYNLDDQGGKTPFDPCPQGWRTPAFKVYTSPWACVFEPIENTGERQDLINGYYFNNSGRELGYYSAGGNRDPDTASLNFVGGKGAVWSASAYPPSWEYGVKNNWALNFWFEKATNMNPYAPTGTYFKATAMNVRCVQDN